MMDNSERAASGRRSVVGIRPGWAVASLLLVVVSVALAFWQAPFPRPEQRFWQRGWVERFIYPIEVNAPMRLPSAPGKMYGLAVAGDRVWAVGVGGTILTTADDGATWTEQVSGTRADLSCIQFHADGLRGWAVGSGGTILATTDGGLHWNTQDSGTDAYLSSLQVLADGQRVWATGSGGTIRATTDGGTLWTAQTSGTNSSLASLQFNADGRRGWAADTGGTILATTDGGESWVKQDTGTTQTLWSVHVSRDGRRGWAVGDSGTIVATGDGGQSWTRQESRTTTSLFDISMDADGRHGWAAGDGVILTTVDGGGHWEPQASITQAILSSIRFHADGWRGWVTGGSGTILATTDGGRSWSAQTSAMRSALTNVQFDAEGRRGWAVGFGGTILSTADGGRSWTAQNSRTNNYLSAIHVNEDGKRGWVVGRKGMILRTDDGGTSWAKLADQPRGLPQALNAIDFQMDGQRGWVVGDGGTILATDGDGVRWEAQDSGTASNLGAVQFQADGRQGWVVGGEGTILVTSDGGQSWTKQKSGTDAFLWSVQFLADGARGWVAGEHGTILTTSDAGNRWTAQESGTRSVLYAVRFDAEGRQGWAVGSAGVTLRTDDSGETWTEMDSKVGSARLGLWADSTGQNVWAPGYPPAMLHSGDGGRTWTPEAWPLRYARYPAPWFWVNLVVAGFLWRRSVVYPPAQAVEGAEAVGLTDAPTSDFSQDRLRFGPLARGISRFLRNAATVPPLTLAISGGWGSGKTSLMALTCADLRRYGCRPVWFNAWHHQKDEQLLAGLLTAVRNQALPSPISLDGLAFRLRLLRVRSIKYAGVTIGLAVLLAGIAGFMVERGTADVERIAGAIQRLAPLITEATKDGAAGAKAGNPTPGQGGSAESDLATLAPPTVGLVATLALLVKALTAFGAKPAVLLTAMAERFRVKDATALTGFRARFAKEFGEVAEALPQRMVIVIDDLDRCRAEAILEIMEAVNFLVSSGPCFVLFGMATERVQAALALSFDKIAAETADKIAAETADKIAAETADKIAAETADKIAAETAGVGVPGNTPAEAQDKEAADRETRRRYAQDYLEKLVNLEVVVPSLTDSNARHLFDREEPAEQGHGVDRWQRAMRVWPVAAVLLALGVGGGLGTYLARTDRAAKPEVKAAPLRPVAGTATPAVGGAAPPAVRPMAPQETQRFVPTVQKGDDKAIGWPVLATPLGLLGALLAWYTVFRLRRATHRVQDSRGFRDALGACTPLLRSQRTTPRAIKRFGNRVRYMAMLHQAERLDESGLDLVRRMVERALGRTRSVEGRRGGTETLDMSGETIVVLSALNECFGAAWQDCARGRYSSEAQQGAVEAMLGRLTAGGGPFAWPRPDAELDRFDASLRGVRTPSR